MHDKENMFQEGDWVHTQDGIGMITNVLPIYYQYWEKELEEKERKETYGDDQELVNRLHGKVKDVGEWVQDMIYIKRLCNHDCNLLTRTMCFYTKAYANDEITQKEMQKVNKILKDPKIKQKFEKYNCKYNQFRHTWEVTIPASKAVEIKKALDILESNGKLNMTMNEIESYFKKSFNVDIHEGLNKKIFNNATIHTLALADNDDNYYNENREQLFCKIMITKQSYREDYLANLIKAHNLDSNYYDNEVWKMSGWDGDELES